MNKQCPMRPLFAHHCKCPKPQLFESIFQQIFAWPPIWFVKRALVERPVTHHGYVNAGQRWSMVGPAAGPTIDQSWPDQARTIPVVFWLRDRRERALCIFHLINRCDFSDWIKKIQSNSPVSLIYPTSAKFPEARFTMSDRGCISSVLLEWKVSRGQRYHFIRIGSDWDGDRWQRHRCIVTISRIKQPDITDSCGPMLSVYWGEVSSAVQAFSLKAVLGPTIIQTRNKNLEQ